MRTLQQNEVKSVSGAGLLTSVLSTGARATVALGKGAVEATTIVVRPVATTTVRVLRFLI